MVTELFLSLSCNAPKHETMICIAAISYCEYILKIFLSAVEIDKGVTAQIYLSHHNIENIVFCATKYTNFSVRGKCRGMPQTRLIFLSLK